MKAKKKLIHSPQRRHQPPTNGQENHPVRRLRRRDTGLGRVEGRAAQGHGGGTGIFI